MLSLLSVFDPTVRVALISHDRGRTNSVVNWKQRVLKWKYLRQEEYDREMHQPRAATEMVASNTISSIYLPPLSLFSLLHF